VDVPAAGRTQTIPQVPLLTQFTAAPISLLLADPVAATNFDLFIQDRMVRRFAVFQAVFLALVVVLHCPVHSHCTEPIYRPAIVCA
jgi:hypothetical protein